MIVYHGSNSRFDTLRIRKDLVKSSATLLNEGMGIYFSLNKNVANSYGKYLYTLELNDKKVLDFRKKSVCKQYIMGIVKEVLKQEDIYINTYFDINTVVESVFRGQVGVTGVSREISLLLDSNERWYNLSESKINQVFKILEKYDEKHLVAYLFNYNIDKVGIIKRVDPEIVRIISREKVN